MTAKDQGKVEGLIEALLIAQTVGASYGPMPRHAAQTIEREIQARLDAVGHEPLDVALMTQRIEEADRWIEA